MLQISNAIEQPGQHVVLYGERGVGKTFLVNLLAQLLERDAGAGVVPPGTDPRDRPPADTWPASWVQRAALACRNSGVALALVTDGNYLTLVHAAAGVATGAGTWRAAEFPSEPILLDSFTCLLGARRFTGVKAGEGEAA